MPLDPTKNRRLFTFWGKPDPQNLIPNGDGELPNDCLAGTSSHTGDV